MATIDVVTPDMYAGCQADRFVSPFRYAGGKTWLTDTFQEWCRSLPERPSTLLEPFAGGASVGLTAAVRGLFERVQLVEIDAAVAAVWQVIIDGTDRDFDELCRRMLNFPLNEVTVLELLDSTPVTVVDRALQTLVKNRVRRGGILAPGAGLMRSGDQGRGLQSRWTPTTLVGRLVRIRMVRDRLGFTHGDGVAAMESSPHCALFVDPPYTAATARQAGLRLYTHFECDHERILDLLGEHPVAVFATYDDDPWMRAACLERGLSVTPVKMFSAHHVRRSELVITNCVPGRDSDDRLLPAASLVR